MGRKTFELVKQSSCAPIIVEPQAGEGIHRIAEKSRQDIELVTGVKPRLLEELPVGEPLVVLYAVIGSSPLLETLVQQGKLDLSTVAGRRETYGIRIVEQPWQGIERALVIYGSEKRGLIYGIFSLSEYIGVSPLVFWGDAKPVHQEALVLDEQVEQISKEPSVKYRGFFINDEWPCFGNWTMNHYGGFNANMYDKVFELLLRLKGNYLWPAMWTSSFALDGPGEENARLADSYGIILGNSHHEPCLRAGEEWDIYRGEQSIYGNEWNYVTNKKGLLKYWEDGLKRSGGYESIITVGMRGERDSIMQGPQSLADNIAVLKDIIENQNHLIEACETVCHKKIPRLLAVYKEVERYFYGDEHTIGLREWEGLENIILMLCEDNYGNLRALPDEAMRQHQGGYGMYYHLDYHGSPVSYEWMNSTPLVRIWEQMTECYEYGVRDVWMVNVGDLKGNEFPLSYFLTLAYDFETWGTTDTDSPRKFTAKWLKQQFGSLVTAEQLVELQEVLTAGIYLNSLRKPEALDASVYHPVNYMEADRMLAETDRLLSMLAQIKQSLSKECQNAFYSMIEYPIHASMNLIQMHLYAGKNEHYARQGKKIANHFGALVTQSIQRDKQLGEEFATAFEGKWRGMELGKHVGFRKWNEDGCRYPLRMQVELFDRPRMVVSRADSTDICVKNYGQPEAIEIRDFCYSGTETVTIEVANDGVGALTCTVEMPDCSWLAVDWTKKSIQEQEKLIVSVNKDKLPLEEESCSVFLGDGDTVVELIVCGKKITMLDLPPMTFYEKDGVTMMYANHYAEILPAENARIEVLEGYGKTGYGLKVFPEDWSGTSSLHSTAVTYRVYNEQTGDYQLEIWSAPVNPLTPTGRLYFGIEVNGQTLAERIPSVSASYQSGDPDNAEWSDGVLNQIRISKVKLSLVAGVNEITIHMMDLGFVLEGLLLCRDDRTILPSYLGPNENTYQKNC
ncbi:glycosyl hydrolase 115 family protein [Anaerosporobacter sp.]|uniref:glycosyl hydrolase 115 family protein n=1 Tax=Anaerosporobacter sp. TaxID=1872529 RepID=UPI00286EB7B4|nr:glycosyl hydrolase 115 family protein [Anaerosporobacter sp.]